MRSLADLGWPVDTPVEEDWRNDSRRKQRARDQIDAQRVVCPHCAGRSGRCCACKDERIVTWPTAVRACANGWARPGCACAACRRNGSRPFSELDNLKGQTEP